MLRFCKLELPVDLEFVVANEDTNCVGDWMAAVWNWSPEPCRSWKAR